MLFFDAPLASGRVPAAAPVPGARCRSCGSGLEYAFLDLGLIPTGPAVLPMEAPPGPEAPFHLLVCHACYLVQSGPGAAGAPAPPERRWLEASDLLDLLASCGLGAPRTVLELGDGGPGVSRPLAERGARCHTLTVDEAGAEGAEPTPSEGADLILGFDPFGGTTRLAGLVAGLKRLLNPGGVLVTEFPHLIGQYDPRGLAWTRHGRHAHLSLFAVEGLLSRHGLAVFDAEERPAHGGSLRVLVRHAEDEGRHPTRTRVHGLRALERAGGVDVLSTYAFLTPYLEHLRAQLLTFLTEARERREEVVVYAPQEWGCTLLHYAGVGPDLAAYVVDAEHPGGVLAGTRLPIRPPEHVRASRPAWVLVLSPSRVAAAQAELDVSPWGGRFVVATPDLRVLP